MPETATVQITMPEMGESVTEGIVLEWHVAEGTPSRRATPSSRCRPTRSMPRCRRRMDGVITKIVAQVDDEVPVGAPLAEMEAGEGSGDQGQGDRPAGLVAQGTPPPAATGGGPPYDATHA